MSQDVFVESVQGEWQLTFVTVQNNTCVLTPEVTEGPYVWPRSQTLRMDMTEGEVGVPLTLDVGILDMATCEPLPDALVSFWHCNATGSYSSFTHLSPNTRFEELLNQLNITDFEIGVTDLHTDDTTFLRGMWPTNSEGIMEMQTIFPGFYVERAIHIHTQVFTDCTCTCPFSSFPLNLVHIHTYTQRSRVRPRQRHRQLRQPHQHRPDLLRRRRLCSDHGP